MGTNSFFYIESLGDLYEAVQAQRVFPDSKYFVDCTPRTDAASIVKAYHELKQQPGFDLKLFVTTHFILPPEIHSNYLSANKPLLQHIEDLWGVLKRIPAIQSTAGTLISLPDPYIVPGGRFREIFYWDSYFTMLGLQVSQHIDLIESMIDNLVHLAHNVEVGEHSFLVAQVGVSGSTKLGQRVILAGQVGVAGHIELGDGVQVSAQSGVHRSVPAGETVSGYPARPHREWLQIMGHLPKLPDLYQHVKQLEQKVNELSARLDQEQNSSKLKTENPEL